MYTLPWKESRTGAPLNVRTVTLLVSVATAGAFAYGAFATLAHQTASATTRIAAGESHACELTSGGGVKCWGYNGDGELGDNTTSARLAPVDVSGLTAGVTAIAAGGYHACALTSAGAVKCWGRNFEGQLGDLSQNRRLTPVDVSGLTAGVSAIAAGGFHTCALTSGGAVRCWGNNRYGQLGDNTTADQLTPVEVSGLTAEVTAIAAGANHTCALMSGGALKCWGYNYYGQVGDNTTSTRLTPVDASALAAPVTAVTAGTFHTCALTDSGWIKFGANGSCNGRSRS